MPWTGSQFRERHNHGLSPGQADHAAHIANAILKRSGDEGMAIATANKMAGRVAGGWLPHRDTGGSMDPTSSIGGLTPSASTQNPVVQSLVQRYSGLSTEKLQELSMALGTNSTQGKIVSTLLNQRRTMPQQNQQQTQQSSFQPQQVGQAVQQSASSTQPGAAQQGQQTQGFAYGGDPMGVSPSMAEPWWTRREASSADSGYLSGSSLGRADAVKTTAPSGSYVLPADVISGLGEGNSMAGARVMQSIISTGPYGTSLPRITHGRGPPSPPRLSQSAVNAMEAKGGGVQGEAPGRTPVALSHGEMVIAPHQVAYLGGGDLKRGHRILDAFVKEIRKRIIAKLKKLPGPVGAKK